MRGELDWIVMKALEKDRGRRYETANGFARDIERFLADEPVEACPPSAGYRLRKFARKYRKPLATAATILGLVLTAGAITTWQAVRLARRRRGTLATASHPGMVRGCADRGGVLRRGRVFITAGAAALPGRLWINHTLAFTLAHMRPPQTTEAIGYYRAALAVRPASAGVYNNLGNALKDTNDLTGALACHRRAIELDPKFFMAHYNVGNTLRAQGNLPGAVASYRRALAIEPRFVQAHYNLGNALRAQGDQSGAAASYRRALEINPNFARAHNNLGLALKAQGDLAGATACFRRAIEVDPRHAPAYSNLGLAYKDQGRWADAIASFRRAIELDPKNATAYLNLGLALLEQGEFAAALAALQTGAAVSAQGRDGRQPSEKWIRKAKRMIELEAQLSELVNGRREPTDVAEGLELADLCHYKQLYAGAVRFYTAAFATDTRLADDLKAAHRYNAACFAALAAAGHGKDADRPDVAERARLRRQALDWLRADLRLRAQQLETGKPQDRDQVQRALRHWQRDADLAGVRDAAALAQLPADERKPWRQFWADVAVLLKKTVAEGLSSGN